jgi:regulator of sigma E protease
VAFLSWEMITGKSLPQKFLEYAQMVGIIFLLGLMLYANGLDVLRGLGLWK